MRNILVTGGAGFIGSNLALSLEKRFPEARVVVVDDFRSGFFGNLRGFRGQCVAADISRLDWNERFRRERFDAVFHLASITDTTVDDVYRQVHDNVEGFRRLLEFAAPAQAPLVYASSASVYGVSATVMSEGQAPAPANAYAFSKLQMDHLARRFGQRYPSWRIVGLRYFNVYGMGEAHKGKMASMVFQLYRQMKQGKRPRLFRAGEQKRDFVCVKDVVDCTIKAMEAPRSNVYNCGTGVAFSFNEIVGLLNSMLGTALPPDYFENPYGFYQAHTQADLTMIKKELDYEPRYRPEKGMADYIQELQRAYP